MGADREVAIIFFDGECNLCNSSVNFIIQRDSKKKFNFASLQSDSAKNLLSTVLLEEKNLSTIILKKSEVLFFKSDAALEISKSLNGLWPIFYLFKIVPKFIRDLVYDYIASHRYRWFGKTTCMIPTPDLKARFLQ